MTTIDYYYRLLSILSCFTLWKAYRKEMFSECHKSIIACFVCINLIFDNFESFEIFEKMYDDCDDDDNDNSL